MKRIILATLILTFIPLVSAHGGDEEPEVWLPNLFFNANDSFTDFAVDTTTLPGRWLYRFRTSLPNIGLGPLVLEATGIDSGDGRETVVQHIFRSDGTSFTRPAGAFRYNPENERMEAKGWSEFVVREILPDDGIGPVVAYGGKLAVRITSSALFTSAIPNVVPRNQSIIAEGGSHGISVGYTDIYTRSLDQQWVDVTGVCGGEYWLEIVLNRHRHILESSYSNNVTRFKITLPPQGENEIHCRTGEDATHSADRNRTGAISLSDLLRVIQLFNMDEYGCAEAGTISEDGYVPGDSSNRDCPPHNADFQDGDWRINFSELLRQIQFFNSFGYYYCPEAGTEDGFCPFP